ncbi:MAG: hypothetical protein RIB41_09960 [Oceanibaculum nanhaiense]|jgi:hypothetical protein|uniref:hypothetical protein n=1 Tax=Oceanibaculum nanhaiense TaxID=1909734 RepID=UPI0032EE905A
MKTHDIARALTVLAKALRNGPNVPIEEAAGKLHQNLQQDTTGIAVSLSTLASLSSYGKGEWLAVINEFNLPIEIRPRDAARDVLGKLLTYLEQNKAERERITREARNKTKSSSEVTSALQFLLRNA